MQLQISSESRRLILWQAYQDEYLWEEIGGRLTVQPDHSAYLNRNIMYVLDGQEHRTVVQPDPESLAANILPEAGQSTTQLPFSS